MNIDPSLDNCRTLIKTNACMWLGSMLPDNNQVKPIYCLVYVQLGETDVLNAKFSLSS